MRYKLYDDDLLRLWVEPDRESVGWSASLVTWLRCPTTEVRDSMARHGYSFRALLDSMPHLGYFVDPSTEYVRITVVRGGHHQYPQWETSLSFDRGGMRVPDLGKGMMSLVSAYERVVFALDEMDFVFSLGIVRTMRANAAVIDRWVADWLVGHAQISADGYDVMFPERFTGRRSRCCVKVCSC